jgi:hypothetical protein
MENEKFLSVRRMSKYQHYKINNPPWIKLYRSLWGEPEFSMLPDATKAHVIGLYSLCSQHNNVVPFDKKWISEELRAREDVDFDAILKTGFIVIIEKRRVEKSREE